MIPGKRTTSNQIDYDQYKKKPPQVITAGGVQDGRGGTAGKKKRTTRTKKKSPAKPTKVNSSSLEASSGQIPFKDDNESYDDDVLAFATPPTGQTPNSSAHVRQQHGTTTPIQTVAGDQQHVENKSDKDEIIPLHDKKNFLELESSLREVDDSALPPSTVVVKGSSTQAADTADLSLSPISKKDRTNTGGDDGALHHHQQQQEDHTRKAEIVWLSICFLGIMASFVCYGLLLEYTTSGGRKLHELSFLFVTSGLYTMTAAAGRYVRDETPTTIPPARFAILGLTSMGSTFCSVRSLRYVIYPIQVLAKSCKPVPVMIMGTFMGKRYPFRKYVNVVLIVLGVALFMGGGDNKKKASSTPDADDDDGGSSASQLFGILLLFVSLCFDGGTGAYEDKLMSVHSVQPFDLMYNIQLGKTILAGIGLLVFNQIHIFMQMCQDMGFLLVALGISGAMGQVFIFITIAKFGALTCSIIGLARKVTTLVASIYFYGHTLNATQFFGLVISVTAMVLNFMGKKKGGGGHGHGGGGHGGGGGKSDEKKTLPADEEMQQILGSDGHQYRDDTSGDEDLDDEGKYSDTYQDEPTKDIELVIKH